MASGGDWLTAKQAAQRLGVSASTLDRLVASGGLPLHRFTPRGHRHFWVRDIDAYLASTRVSAAAAPAHTATQGYGRNVDHLIADREFV